MKQDNKLSRSFERVKADIAGVMQYSAEWISFLNRGQTDLQNRVHELEKEIAELKAELLCKQ